MDSKKSRSFLEKDGASPIISVWAIIESSDIMPASCPRAVPAKMETAMMPGMVTWAWAASSRWVGRHGAETSEACS